MSPRNDIVNSLREVKRALEDELITTDDLNGVTDEKIATLIEHIRDSTLKRDTWKQILKPSLRTLTSGKSVDITRFGTGL